MYIYIYMNKQNLTPNNLQWLIYHKAKPNQPKTSEKTIQDTTASLGI